MITPEQTLKEGVEEFDALVKYGDDTDTVVERSKIKAKYKNNTRNLLTALKTELEGDKRDMLVPEGESMPSRVYLQYTVHNAALQQQIDRLTRLIESL